MESPFLTDGYSQLAGRVQAPGGFAEALAMAYADEPDHWMCGAEPGSGFLGPTGMDLSGLTEQQKRAAATLDRDVRAGLRRSFTPVDLLSEILGRRVDAVLAHPPRTFFEDPDAAAPEAVAEVTTGSVAEEPPARDERLAELDAVLAWAESPRVDLHGTLRQLVRAVTCFGRASLRPVVPAPRLTERPDGTFGLDAATIAEALRHIFVEVVTPDRGVLDEDPATRAEVSVVSTPGDAGQPDAVEVSFLDEEDTVGDHPVTRVRVIEKGTTVTPDGVRYPLRGRPYLVELRDASGALLDANARGLQKAINTASTEWRIVLDEAGFPIRLLLGARPSGRWLTEAEATAKDVEHPHFEFEPWRLSPRSVTNIGGEETYADDLGPDGRPVATAVSRPTAATFDAANPKGYVDEVHARSLQLLSRCKQAWVMTTGEAGVSGVSREVAMADYLADAEGLAANVSACAEALLELVADLAAHLMGAPGRYYSLRARAELRVSKPPVQPAERLATLQLLDAGVWSRRRTMQANGVDDVDAETKAVAQERDEQAARETAQGLALFGAVPGESETIEPGDLEAV